MEHAFHLLLLESFFRNNRHIQKQITAAGLFPGQPKILEFLLTHDGCSQKEIGIGCILDKSSVTSLVKRMEKTGLVYKKQDTQDQRAFHIFLTSTGKKNPAGYSKPCRLSIGMPCRESPQKSKQPLSIHFKKLLPIKRNGMTCQNDKPHQKYCACLLFFPCCRHCG